MALLESLCPADGRLHTFVLFLLGASTQNGQKALGVEDKIVLLLSGGMYGAGLTQESRLSLSQSRLEGAMWSGSGAAV